jgi:hypothetical protein
MGSRRAGAAAEMPELTREIDGRRVAIVCLFLSKETIEQTVASTDHHGSNDAAAEAERSS